MKNDRYYNKLIMDAIIERNNECSYQKLKRSSNEYQKLENENDNLAKNYSCINEILENTTISNRTYNFEEISALSLYCQNKNKMEDLERFEIYLYGLIDKQNLLNTNK